MRKGYVELLLGWFFMLIVFVLVNWYISARIYYEAGTSDVAGQTYKLIDAIEFAKINSQQNLKFAVQKTENDLKLSQSDILNNKQDQATFLNKLKDNYYPSQDYSDVDVSITLNSLKIDGNYVVASNSFSSITDQREAGLTTDIAVPLG
jgi:hypothetical protein